MKKQNTKELNIVGYAFIFIGFFLCLTVIGAIVGIPLMISGYIAIRKAQKQEEEEKAEQRAFETDNAERTRQAIADGIVEGLRKAKEAEVASTTTSTKETNK
jgi:hypothetical protein